MSATFDSYEDGNEILALRGKWEPTPKVALGVETPPPTHRARGGWEEGQETRNPPAARFPRGFFSGAGGNGDEGTNASKAIGHVSFGAGWSPPGAIKRSHRVALGTRKAALSNDTRMNGTSGLFWTLLTTAMEIRKPPGRFWQWSALLPSNEKPDTAPAVQSIVGPL
ncbi:hypothetical protein ZHAS_00006539 [Anopheles sinensis]|uniref:Uncharacterized protein n=1 Tax=Anopheles sinensis TaxID=74873 RepID=A0A084VMK5_ANOSI|nr:hypothetical protein ZHAS_00006539 [Anopheles sinensis]